jgi:hypothetical protein
MTKLARLKEWHTLQDTARFLSNKLKEEFSAADILRFGLQGDLKLSFNFVNLSPAAIGIIESTDEGEILGFPQWHAAIRWFWLPHRRAAKRPQPAANPAREIRNETDWIDGVWDLLMIEDAVHAVERLYQRMTGGPEVQSRLGDGIILASADGRFARLQVAAEKREIHPDHQHNYKLSRELPTDDGVLVIRDAALTEFEARLHAPFVISDVPRLIGNALRPPLPRPNAGPHNAAAESPGRPFLGVDIRSAHPKDAWKIEARRLADEIAMSMHKAGLREITTREVSKRVARRLEDDPKYDGKKGPREWNTIRSKALTGWRFRRPKDNEPSGSNGSDGSSV